MHLELTPSLCPLNIAPFHNYRKYRTSPRQGLTNGRKFICCRLLVHFSESPLRRPPGSPRSCGPSRSDHSLPDYPAGHLPRHSVRYLLRYSGSSSLDCLGSRPLRYLPGCSADGSDRCGPSRSPRCPPGSSVDSVPRRVEDHSPDCSAGSSARPHPSLAAGHPHRGVQRRRAGRPAEALREFDRALEYPPNLATGKLENAREAHINFLRGNALVALGRKPEAMTAWKLAADEPKSSDSKKEEARQKAREALAGATKTCTGSYQ